jgi:hypothetical protein
MDEAGEDKRRLPVAEANLGRRIFKKMMALETNNLKEGAV